MVSAPYTAGLLDGEGSIMLLGQGEGRPLRPAVEIGMVDEAPVRAVADKYGGFVKVQERPQGRQTMYIASIKGARCLALLRDVQPHLVIERRKTLASILLTEAWECGPGSTQANIDRRARVLALRDEMRRANAERLAPPAPLPTRKLSKPDAAYLAGIIDGEGHVAPTGRLDVWSTDPELPCWLAQFAGTYRADVKSAAGNSRALHRWWTRTAEGRELLAAATPYMLLDRKLPR